MRRLCGRLQICQTVVQPMPWRALLLGAYRLCRWAFSMTEHDAFERGAHGLADRVGASIQAAIDSDGVDDVAVVTPVMCWAGAIQLLRTRVEGYSDYEAAKMIYAAMRQHAISETG